MSNQRLCIGCKHYHVSHVGSGNPFIISPKAKHECHRLEAGYIEVSMVTGQEEARHTGAVFDCNSERRHDAPGYCGTTGRFWEAKDGA